MIGTLIQLHSALAVPWCSRGEIVHWRLPDAPFPTKMKRTSLHQNGTLQAVACVFLRSSFCRGAVTMEYAATVNAQSPKQTMQCACSDRYFMCLRVFVYTRIYESSLSTQDSDWVNVHSPAGPHPTRPLTPNRSRAVTQGNQMALLWYIALLQWPKLYVIT